MTEHVWGIWLYSSKKWLMRPSDASVITYLTKAEAAAYLHNHAQNLRDGAVQQIGDDGLPVVYRADRELDITRETE